MSPPWLPLAERSLIEPSLARIVRELKSDAGATPRFPGLLVGRAGLALFFLYYARFTDASIDRAFAESFVSDLFETLPDEVSFSFSTGLAGLAWLLRHAASTGLLEVNADEALEDIDRQLHARMVDEIRAGRWDFLHGALGCSLYFLETANRPSSRAPLTQVLEELERQSIEAGAALYWRNTDVIPREGLEEGVNMGLSHGMPSIVNLLARFVGHELDSNRTTVMLDRSVAYVLKQEAATASGLGSSFPAFVPDDEPDRCRLAWCYGDGGIAATLWQAGEVAHRSEWQAKAVAVLERATSRRTPELTRVTDAGLCHGSAGLALIFARMYHATGGGVFREAALHWLDTTLAMGNRGNGFAGYRADLGDAPEDLAAQLSVLMGIAGVGLALMALCSSIEPAWDRALLLS